jgi:RNA polymerase sigma factor (sigma-70 family)
MKTDASRLGTALRCINGYSLRTRWAVTWSGWTVELFGGGPNPSQCHDDGPMRPEVEPSFVAVYPGCPARSGGPGRNPGPRSRLYVDVVSRTRAAVTGRGPVVTQMWDVNAVPTEDDIAFSEFYAGQFSRIASITTVIMRSRASGVEVAQDAFVQLYVHWRKVRHYDAPEAWVRRVAIRLAVREARRDSRRHELSIDSWRPDDHDASPRDFDVLRAVADLPPTHRAIVAMYYFDDLSVGEIARALGRSEGSVKVTLHRARRSLALKLGGEVDPHG